MAFDYNSPLGMLGFFVVFGLIFLLVFGRKNVYKNPDHRQRTDYTGLRSYEDGMRCPECGSTNVKFDTLEMLNPPVMVTCSDCKHEFIWVPPRL